MNRRQFLNTTTAALTLAAAPRIAQARQIPLDRISAYFNSFETARARFTQINADRTRSSGTLYMRRPGRARFEYDPPEDSLVIVGGGQVAIFDGKSNLGRPEQYPLRRTPLSIVLERRVDLARRQMVVAHRYDGTHTIVVAQDPRNPEYGHIELYFGDNPVTLDRWVVVDGSGARTTIVLENMVTGENMRASLFNITMEEERRQR